MNTENSKTNEPHRFKLDLADKLNLKNPNKNIALVNLSIYYTWKTLNLNTTTINLRFLHQLGVKLLIYLMVHNRITLNLSQKSMKLQLITHQ